MLGPRVVGMEDTTLTQGILTLKKKKKKEKSLLHTKHQNKFHIEEGFKYRICAAKESTDLNVKSKT